jgi:DNA-binding LacI/PurR family transcriptional regulator
LAKYAIVFPHRPNNKGEFNNFWHALSREAVSFAVENRTIEAYYGVTPSADNEDFQQLCRTAKRHLVAGFIFPSPPFSLADTPILTEPNLPRVSVSMMETLPAPMEDFSTIRLFSIVDKALAYLAARGRRRVAVVHGGDPRHHAEWLAGMQRYGMQVDRRWVQVMSPGTPAWARNLINLLAHRNQHEAPDGLVIADDNLVEHATAGLLDAGVRVPEDIEVVAHCNFPWPTPSHLAVKRLGYDTREIIAAAVNLIDARRAGKERASVPIEAKFEEELVAD